VFVDGWVGGKNTKKRNDRRYLLPLSYSNQFPFSSILSPSSLTAPVWNIQLCASIDFVDTATMKPKYEKSALPTMEPETSHFAEWAKQVPLSLAVVFAAAGGVVSHPPFSCSPYSALAPPASQACKDQVGKP